MNKPFKWGALLFSFVSQSVLAETNTNPFQDFYSTNGTVAKVEQVELENGRTQISYKSFDGDQVNGQISYPKSNSDKHPVLIALHAMGRSYPRWWNAEINGSPTITQANKITQMAHKNGYAVVALDARYHGSRKLADKPLQLIMGKMKSGDPELYLDMVQNSIRDYKMLLNWVTEQPQFKGMPIHVVGYSMGAQMSLLLAAADERIEKMMIIVPPNVDEKMEYVSPINAAQFIKHQNVLLLSSNQDQYSSQSEFSELFNAMPTKSKLQIVYDADHILPANYPEVLTFWFE
jgi:dienelactone hydrolase